MFLVWQYEVYKLTINSEKVKALHLWFGKSSAYAYVLMGRTNKAKPNPQQNQWNTEIVIITGQFLLGLGWMKLITTIREISFNFMGLSEHKILWVYATVEMLLVFMLATSTTKIHSHRNVICSSYHFAI